MEITATMSRKEPDYRPLAEYWMNQILAWFDDPENEKEYREWEAAQEAQEGA